MTAVLYQGVLASLTGPAAAAIAGAVMGMAVPAGEIACPLPSEADVLRARSVASVSECVMAVGVFLRYGPTGNSPLD